MLKQQARIIAALVFALDLVLITASFLTAYWLRSTALPTLAPGAFSSHLYPLSRYLPLLPLALTIWGSALLLSGRYRSHRTVPILEEAWAIVRVAGSAAVVFTLTIYALRLDEWLLGQDKISRLWILLFSILAFLALLSEKLALRLTSRYVRTRGFNYPTVPLLAT